MNVDRFSDEELRAALHQIRTELDFREAKAAGGIELRDPRPLEEFTTDDLVAELFERFDGAVFMGEEWRTDELRRELGQWKGDRLRLIGLVEILERRIVNEEMKNRRDNMRDRPQ